MVGVFKINKRFWWCHIQSDPVDLCGFPYKILVTDKNMKNLYEYRGDIDGDPLVGDVGGKRKWFRREVDGVYPVTPIRRLDYWGGNLGRII